VHTRPSSGEAITVLFESLDRSLNDFVHGEFEDAGARAIFAAPQECEVEIASNLPARMRLPDKA
jgi:hypothetical protein